STASASACTTRDRPLFADGGGRAQARSASHGGRGPAQQPQGGDPTGLPLHASATDCPLPKFGIAAIGHGHLLAVTILIGRDRSTTIRLPLAALPRTP